MGVESLSKSLEPIEVGRTVSSLEALHFEAPYLIERLVKNGVADDRDEANALFSEVKKYLILATIDKARGWQMYSLRVDEAWHQFILYTSQYATFCQRFFGHYVHHAPNNAPQSEAAEKRLAEDSKEASFADFCRRYEELFGTPLPEIWYDARNMTLGRRVRNEHAGTQEVRRDGDMVDLVSASGEVLFSVNDIAIEALSFVARVSVFYVRELPGELEDDEKTALVTTLVESGVLKVAN